MNETRLREEWLALAPAWIQEARAGRNPTREGLLDPPLLAFCGDVAGLDALDCGCGEGRFCRLLAARGARRVLGLDSCPTMIAASRERGSAREEYRVADVQALGFLPDASFDLAVSCLNQCDLPDAARNTREVCRVLRPGGRFLVANLHPMRSAVGGWQRGDDGAKQHVILDRYCDEGERRWQILGTTLTNFHRTLATALNGFLDAGFILERLVEPTPSDEMLARYPELDDECRVPNFIIYALRKGG